MKLQFKVNGRSCVVDAPPGESLLDVIRDRLHLTGTKEGCREGECGACTVLLDDKPIDACIFAAHAAAGLEVETIEGLNASGELTPLQQAFVDCGGTQCGFCTPGFIMMLTALLRETPAPDAATVREAIAGNICRCTGYAQIEDAVQKVITK